VTATPHPSGPAVLILGASGGIGSALTRRLASGGARLVLGARDADRLNALAGETGATVVTLDATRPAEVEAAAAQAVERFGQLDGVANCVGSLLLKPAHLTSEEEWSSTLALNLTSSFAAVRAAARSMSSGGSVMLMSSAAGRLGLANHEAVAAAKAGVIGLTLSAAATYAPKGIRVNALAPGLVRTPLTARITGSETALKASTALHALGRVGEPDEVVGAIAWLLDPAQSWITGQVLGVDGGLATVRSRG
jgi:NAD(P)-dependent dehydrogenase (short-subunit alcohol dehydrogenase family)